MFFIFVCIARCCGPIFFLAEWTDSGLCPVATALVRSQVAEVRHLPLASVTLNLVCVVVAVELLNVEFQSRQRRAFSLATHLVDVSVCDRLFRGLDRILFAMFFSQETMWAILWLTRFRQAVLSEFSTVSGSTPAFQRVWR